MGILKKISALFIKQDSRVAAHQERRKAFGILATPEMIDEAKQEQARTASLFRQAIAASKAVKSESLDDLTRLAFVGIRPFAPHDIFSGFKQSPKLTLVEKKALGLNARKVYWASLVNCFYLEKIKTMDPKDLMDKCYRQALCAAFRESQISRASKDGFDEVILSSLNDCILLDGQQFSLSDLPDLPHKDCTQRVCMCRYSPVLPMLSGLDAAIRH